MLLSWQSGRARIPARATTTHGKFPTTPVTVHTQSMSAIPTS